MQNYFHNIIHEIIEINRATGAPNLTHPVEILESAPDSTINIAVLGQFKSGKSSLINSLVGENILPVGVVPVTAIVTQLLYGETPKLVIQFMDGTEMVTSLDKLPLYVTEKQNPENILNVRLAIVKHPALEQYRNVSFADTPGLGSFYRHNSDTTLQWLPYTGVAIISVSAERPLSEEDIGLVKGIARYCPDVALVVIKTDMFTQSELNEIKSYISNSVKQAIIRNIPIFDYSIHQKVQEHRDNLNDQFIRPLSLDPEKKIAEITRFKIATILDQSIQYAELGMQAALKREQQKELISRILEEVSNNRDYIEQDLLLRATAFKGDVRSKLESIVFPYQPEIISRVTTHFNSNYHAWEGTLSRVSRTFEQWLKETLGKEITMLDQECFDKVNKIVSETVAYYGYAALQFRQRLDEKLHTIFGVHLPEASWQIEFAGIDKPDISIYRAFDSHLDMLLFFLPMKYSGRIFFKHFQKQIPDETEKNLYRYISDITGKIIKAIDNIHKQALQYISNETRSVEHILQNEKNNHEELQKYLMRLCEIKNQFNE